MFYPKRKISPVSRQMVDTFKGYNHNLRISDGEFYDMKNMTSDHYPVLSPRRPRGKYMDGNFTGMIAKDSLCYVDGNNFVINEHIIDMGLNDEPKQLISMGAYVIILPDKKYINTENLDDYGDIEASFTNKVDEETFQGVSFSLCKLTGEEYEEYLPSPTSPEDPKDLALWVDTSTSPHALKQYSESAGMWVSVGTTYIKITAPGISSAFEKYDGIEINWVNGIASKDLSALQGANVVWEKSGPDDPEDYIVIVGLLDHVMLDVPEHLEITRSMPEMDFVVESQNRLWGCKYGINEDGKVVNELYASKLGDFKNWKCFMGISTDSWAASLGSDGVFTGAITHLGYPLFFKENCLHKVYISSSGAHQVQETPCRGVQRGCERSLAIVNETLYYKARHAVCAYDGSLPIEISYALGDAVYGEAVAGVLGNKYYISMGINESWHLFVYDVAKGMWHREDDLKVDCFCTCRDDLYIATGNEIITVRGSGEVWEEKVPWMVQTGEIGIYSPDMKNVSRMVVRMALDMGAEVKFYAQYDSCNEWELLFILHGTSLRSFSIPIRPKRCDHMKLRIEGLGNAKIYSITKTIEEGSDVS